MSPENFRYLCALIKTRSGLVLTEEKAYLVENRLMPIVRQRRLDDIEEIVHRIQREGDEELIRQVTEAMTTNESYFFRDVTPFDQFRQIVLPHVLEARPGGPSIRIWSAACSTGQEPYSLAMLIKDHEDRFRDWRVEISATDIATNVLDKARDGIYSQFEVQRGLPVQYMVKYFNQNGDKWQVDESIRRLVKFSQFNLLEEPIGLGVFDVIFCRNVLIYFDQDTKRKVLERIHRVLKPDGFLFLGGAETVLGLSEDFSLVPDQRGIYESIQVAPVIRQAAV